ncbi:hypothetical protein N7508_004309 [Penicillium antarcticum]|uniref:uncharacterized protein n=1 Tax=Penicillium antarcticum TaxID=416450 RepID=UPI0023978FDC|nr:uncharacterized protein N7508_004309 [Penicillium antarcticum]KAJ5308930.1 hypothetical protein N7508_004309 [Penicillium antarcticum]
MNAPIPLGPVATTTIAIDPYNPLLQRDLDDGNTPIFHVVLYAGFKGAHGIGPHWVGILERTRPDRKTLALTISGLDLTTMPKDVFKLLLLYY